MKYRLTRPVTQTHSRGLMRVAKTAHDFRHVSAFRRSVPAALAPTGMSVSYPKEDSAGTPLGRYPVRFRKTLLIAA